MDILIIGDTRQGKTDTVRKLMIYYDLGTFASGESATRTGLMYNIQIVKGQEAWIQFGLLCRANGLLVVIDEIHGMPPQDFEVLTQVRSDGVVDVKRYAWGRALAETRLISIANPRRGMLMGGYGYPVQAIADLPPFKSKEDISRFDYAVGVRAGDVEDDVINQDIYDVEIPDHPYTKELCKDLILWAWTRKPDQIEIARTTERYILHKAIEFSKEWIADIPLIESADFRYKLLRISAGIAARTFSTKDGINLFINKEHVDAALELLLDLYKSPGLDYWGYSEDMAKSYLDSEVLDSLVDSFTSVYGNKAQEIALWILRINQFNKTLFKTSLQLTGNEGDDIMSVLLSNRFVISGYAGQYKKTPIGRQFLRLVSGQPMDEEEEDEL